MHGEAAAEVDDAEYETLLRERMVTGGKGGLPELDLALVGIGEDGHTASLFPGHRPRSRSPTPSACQSTTRPSPRPTASR